ncbi:MAG TPA: VIT1/CCC1 transporter family protein [Bryobacterales bacterium]|jgi:VIT1/CCC1 family predicted Fe2+/Mn2+ transporter|nr:VIT1/CCC1 transporter family protein [Bryobacterales bacterium]
MSTKQEIARYRANLQDEIDSVSLYNTLARCERQPQLAEVYRRLAAVEERHAHFWEQKLREAGVVMKRRKPGWRSRLLGWLAGRFGPQFVLPTISAMEQADRHDYLLQPETKPSGMPAEEESHARLLRTIAGPRGIEGGVLAQLEGRHRAIGGNALRASVLGVNDGLVSNLSLVMGVAGANLSNRAILITGLAGLLAGACSMALGEWLSVTSSRELYERQIGVEAEELNAVPDEEAEELALIYQSKGLSEGEARSVANRLVSDKATALDTLAREELGIDPETLGGSAWEAAVMSFVLFVTGAILPVAPFMFLSGYPAVLGSLVMSSLGLFGSGAAITLLTGRTILYSGVRQLIIGLGAAALTFGIGKILGVTVAG